MFMLENTILRSVPTAFFGAVQCVDHSNNYVGKLQHSDLYQHISRGFKVCEPQQRPCWRTRVLHRLISREVFNAWTTVMSTVWKAVPPPLCTDRFLKSFSSDWIRATSMSENRSREGRESFTTWMPDVNTGQSSRRPQSFI